MAGQQKIYRFKNPKGLTGAAVVWLWIVLAATLAIVAAQGYEAYVASVQAPNLALPEPSAETGAPLFARLTLFRGVLQILSFILILIQSVIALKWIYRVNANAHALAKGLTNSPPWAVGWFFIPIACVYKPWQAMNETWKVSVDPSHWRKRHTPAIITTWWALWLISNAVSNIVMRLFPDAKTYGDAVQQDIAYIASYAFDFAAAIAFMMVVMDIGRLQVAAINQPTPIEEDAAT